MLYQRTKFQCHTFFPFQYIQQNVLLSSYSWWRHKLLRFILDQPLKQWLIGRKEGKMEIQKLEYLKNKKSFLDEIKNTFHSFWRVIIWWEIKTWKKIEDIGLEVTQLALTCSKLTMETPEQFEKFVKI